MINECWGINNIMIWNCVATRANPCKYHHVFVVKLSTSFGCIVELLSSIEPYNTGSIQIGVAMWELTY